MPTAATFKLRRAATCCSRRIWLTIKFANRVPSSRFERHAPLAELPAIGCKERGGQLGATQIKRDDSCDFTP